MTDFHDYQVTYVPVIMHVVYETFYSDNAIELAYKLYPQPNHIVFLMQREYRDTHAFFQTRKPDIRLSITKHNG